jgi:hypothetical protein
MNASDITVQNVADAAVTADGKHVLLSLRDMNAHDLALRLPAHQVRRLVEVCALALTQVARQSHDIDSKLLDTQGRFRIGFWKRIAGNDGGTTLSLTFESGGVLAFDLSAPVARSMFAAGSVALERSPPGKIGFGELSLAFPHPPNGLCHWKRRADLEAAEATCHGGASPHVR